MGTSFFLWHVVLVFITNAVKPNIVFMLTDDLGWNSMWNNPETITPTLDKLSQNALILESFYTYKYCAPSRGAFLTGRYPFKLCATRRNFVPPFDMEGIHLGYTMLPQKLNTGGYVSYHIGKWHQGMISEAYLPINRGFNYSYGFLSGGEDHYSQITDVRCPNNYPVVDIWNNTHPGYTQNGSYDAYTFSSIAVDVINTHYQKYNEDQPLFLYYALHNTHSPIEAPERFVSMYNFNQSLRNRFDAMVSVVDETVLNVTTALRSSGLWNNTLFVWATDNGGWVTVAGSNKPLRGGKQSNWEGGVRVPALVSGGIVPDAMLGKSLKGLVHILDLHATFCHVAGVDSNETNANAPSGMDALNMWDYFSGKVERSPRTQIVHDHLMYSNVTTGALRSGDYKIIVGTETLASWYGQFSPNETWNNDMKDIHDCSVDAPCLFNVVQDPTEHNDVRRVLVNVTQQLLKEFYALESEYHPPQENPPLDEDGYCKAAYAHKGFQVPWVTP
eukprot:237700_1